MGKHDYSHRNFVVLAYVGMRVLCFWAIQNTCEGCPVPISFLFMHATVCVCVCVEAK